jgi:hypothetical protein
MVGHINVLLLLLRKYTFDNSLSFTAVPYSWLCCTHFHIGIDILTTYLLLCISAWRFNCKCRIGKMIPDIFAMSIHLQQCATIYWNGSSSFTMCALRWKRLPVTDSFWGGTGVPPIKYHSHNKHYCNPTNFS